MDLAILHGIQSVMGCSILDTVMPIVTLLGEKGIVWLLIAVFLLFKRDYRLWGLMIIVAIGAVWVLGDQILKPIIARPRPFLVDPSIQLVIDPPDGYSLPSGHTSSSFAAAMVIALSGAKKPWKVLSFLLAIVIAFSRLYLCVHNPSDVLAGMVLGIVVGLIVGKIGIALATHFQWPLATPKGNCERLGARSNYAYAGEGGYAGNNGPQYHGLEDFRRGGNYYNDNFDQDTGYIHTQRQQASPERRQRARQQGARQRSRSNDADATVAMPAVRSQQTFDEYNARVAAAQGQTVPTQAAHPTQQIDPRAVQTYARQQRAAGESAQSSSSKRSSGPKHARHAK